MALAPKSLRPEAENRKFLQDWLGGTRRSPLGTTPRGDATATNPRNRLAAKDALETSRRLFGTTTKAATQPQQIVGTAWLNVQVRTGLINNKGRQWFVDGCRQ